MQTIHAAGIIFMAPLLVIFNFIFAVSLVDAFPISSYSDYKTWPLPGGSFIYEDDSGCRCYSQYWTNEPLAKCIVEYGRNPCESAQLVPYRHVAKRGRRYSIFNEPLGCVCLDQSMFSIPMRRCYDENGMLLC
ncbi:uncharacterized protein LOC141907907 [Tubulanus polymorphus]|uniref:uncharacterized protein LOC141907907 n=1 Tax=Tubulanus polymorphus TaxID=672921 RepID=UPI003DA4FFBA